MEEHFLYLSSQDCLKYYPNNHGGQFRVQLPQTLHLSGVWKCGLVEFRYTSQFKTQEKTDELIICVNFCDQSYVNNTLLPVLRKITVDYDKPRQKKCTTFTHVYYVPVIPSKLNQIEVYIKGSQHNIVSFTYKVTCVLHLKKVA